MASRRRILSLSAAALAVLGVAGYFVYSVFAAQGQGTLSQSPLNIESQTPPAFIMALDDSGSMNWETLNNTRDGVFTWRNNSFFNGTTPWGYGDVGSDRPRYLMLFPYSGRNNEQNSVPPIDRYGFARSPQFNPAYFDPTIDYQPWKREDGTTYQTINPAAAPADARPAGVNNKINTVFNLTQNVRNADNGWRFRVHNGMVLPRNLVYRLPDNDNRCGNIPKTSGNWVSLGADTTVNNVTDDNTGCRLAIEYFPATFYLTTPTLAGYSATPQTIANAQGMPAGTTLYKYEIRPENYEAGEYEKAIQNFANYFTYYRTRRDALVSALTNSLVDVNNMRVGWFWINDRRAVTMRSMANVTQRQALFNEIYTLRADGSTPSRQAVNYLGNQFRRDPRTDPGAPVQLQCQKNAGMLFTDGYINDGSSPNVGGNLDGGLGAPFADAVSNTMADIVVPFYQNSLVPGIEANAVRVPEACRVTPPALPPKNLDCQTNLHMNFYGVTLGTQGRMFGVSYLPDETNPAVITPDPYTNPPSWHNARVDLDPHAVDEMWHATLNTRGEMINAKTPAAVTAAMRRVLSVVGSGATPSGSIALTGARIGEGSVTVIPFYESRNEGTDWYSRLTAQNVSNNPITGEVTYSFAWEGSAELPEDHTERNILANGASGVVPFSATNITLADLCNSGSPMSRCTAEMISGPGSRLNISLIEAIAYLRGDTALEVRNTGGKLRDRSTRLGDIVNSSPVVTSPNDDFGYRSLRNRQGDGTYSYPYQASYNAFLTSKKSADRPVVYAGANDGMLHAFNGKTGDEYFAYIPRTALGHMGNLLFPYRAIDQNDQVFQHRYYVDGPVVVSDAHYSGSWKSVLVGTAGAGGRGVFALNVTNPGSFDASSVLWDINDRSADINIRNNIGHVLGRPVIVPVKNAAGTVSWKAIFGNGYGSVNNDAVLFVVDIGNGNVTMIRAEEASQAAVPNGLGNVIVLDRYVGTSGDAGRDGYADTVYAGDQNGAVWKFDLRNNSVPANPFFIATDADTGGNRQAILGGFEAASGPGGGVMLFFGTGSFSFEGDKADSQLQTLYGVLDRPGATVAGRSSLVRQTIVSDNALTGARITSTSPMTPGKLGWYLDLGVTSGGNTARGGERFVGYPRIESGVVFFPTYEPNNTTTCGGDGANRLYGLSALNGGAALHAVRVGTPDGAVPGAGTGGFKLDTGGTAPVKDVAVMSTPRVSPLGATPTPAEEAAALSARCWMVVQVAGAPPLYVPRPCGRQSWRQVR
ncbi:pilus assembly protein [Pseudoxanthomonas putridarboris]|uniref:PilC/PilY family type IV pilus protein n=1 Tax=Pseudoxanthomonas putridarboris TaxID=752605 RepID=A0ABU9IYN5_9GAMM